MCSGIPLNMLTSEQKDQHFADNIFNSILVFIIQNDQQDTDKPCSTGSVKILRSKDCRLDQA